MRISVSVFVGLLPFIFGCINRENVEYESIPPVPRSVMEKWKSDNWTFYTVAAVDRIWYKALAKYNPITNRKTVLVDPPGYIASIAVCPSQDSLTYVWQERDNYIDYSEMRTFDVPTKKEKMLYKCSGREIGVLHSLSWSPKGDKLAFLLGPDFSQENRQIWTAKLFVLDLPTLKVRELRTIDGWAHPSLKAGAEYHHGPQLVWSQAGDALYYATAYRELMKLDLATGNQTKIGEGSMPFLEDEGSLFYLLDSPMRICEMSLATGKVKIDHIKIGDIKGFGPCVISPDKQVVGINVIRKWVTPARTDTLMWDRRKGILGMVDEMILAWTKSPSVATTQQNPKN